jgi:hypothetical protein
VSCSRTGPRPLGYPASVLRLTLDTSSVIHGAQAQRYGPEIDELVDLARRGQVGLCVTTAFAVDQETAPADKHQRNLAWLSARPTIGRVPGPFRLNYSMLGGPDVLTDDDHGAADTALRELLLPERLQPGRLDENDPVAMAALRRKITDVQHLTAHLMAGHDAFVTSDQDDMLRRREVIRSRTGIVVVNPAEAVQKATRPWPWSGRSVGPGAAHGHPVPEAGGRGRARAGAVGQVQDRLNPGQAVWSYDPLPGLGLDLGHAVVGQGPRAGTTVAVAVASGR